MPTTKGKWEYHRWGCRFILRKGTKTSYQHMGSSRGMVRHLLLHYRSSTLTRKEYTWVTSPVLKVRVRTKTLRLTSLRLRMMKYYWPDKLSRDPRGWMISLGSKFLIPDDSSYWTHFGPYFNENRALKCSFYLNI